MNSPIPVVERPVISPPENAGFQHAVPEDPRLFVDWRRVDDPGRVASIVTGVDRLEVLRILARVKPDLVDPEKENTRSAYCSDAAHFIAWCAAIGQKLSEVTGEHITHYVLEKPSDKTNELSRRSMNRRMSAVRLLFDALIEIAPHRYVENPIRMRHFSRAVAAPRPKPLPVAKAIEFIQGVGSLTDRALFAFLLYTACREDEVSEIRVKDTLLRKEGDRLLLDVHVRKGKGGRERITYLGGLGLEILREYLRAAENAQGKKLGMEDHLLGNHSGLPWTPRRIRKRFDQWKRKLAINIDSTGWTPHRFRHTLLTEMADADVSIFAMQRISGHASINTLRHYVDARDSKARASYFLTIEKLHG